MRRKSQKPFKPDLIRHHLIELTIKSTDDRDDLINTVYYKEKGFTEQWEKIYLEMTDTERQKLLELIKDNKSTGRDASIGNIRILNIMKFYNMRYEDIKSSEAKIRNVI